MNFIDKTENLIETRSLLKAIEEFEFQFAARVLQKCYDVTGTFCSALQAPTIEMDHCLDLLERTLLCLWDLLDEKKFESIYKESVIFAKTNQIEEPSLSRQKKIPSRFENFLPAVPTFSSAKDNFFSIYYELINTLIREIQDRFEDDSLIPLLIMERILKGKENDCDFQDLKNLEYYNCLIDFQILAKELITWKSTLGNYTNKKKYNFGSISIIVRAFIEEVFDFVIKLLKINKYS